MNSVPDQGIIDYRLRPPLYSYLETGMWGEGSVRKFSALQGIEPSESALRQSFEMMLEEMDANNITIGVMNGRQCEDYRGEVSNHDLARIVSETNGRFLAIAGANPFRGEENVAEAEEYLKNYGFKGISLDPGLYERHILSDDPILDPYYRLCLEYDLPAVLTIGPTVGADISHASAVPVDRLAAKYPDLKVVVSHGCWPYAQELAGVCARRPNVYMMPDMYYLGLPGEDAYTKSITSFGADRFLFATAYPSRPIGMTVEGFLDLPLTQEQLQKVMWDNAARLLRLEG